jgi:hypothetical protein
LCVFGRYYNRLDSPGLTLSRTSPWFHIVSDFPLFHFVSETVAFVLACPDVPRTRPSLLSPPLPASHHLTFSLSPGSRISIFALISAIQSCTMTASSVVKSTPTSSSSTVRDSSRFLLPVSKRYSAPFFSYLESLRLCSRPIHTCLSFCCSSLFRFPPCNSLSSR